MKVNENFKEWCHILNSVTEKFMSETTWVYESFFSNVNIMTSKYRTNISIECLCCAQACLTLCSPTDCGLSGSSVHGIFQARILEQVAISFSRASSQPRDRTCISLSPALQVDSLPLVPPEKPNWMSSIQSKWVVNIKHSLQRFSSASGTFPMSCLVCIRWLKYWSFSFSISPSSQYSEVISLKMDWFHFLAVQGTFRSLSSTTVGRHQFFGALPSLKSSSHNPMWPMGRQYPGPHRPCWQNNASAFQHTV